MGTAEVSEHSNVIRHSTLLGHFISSVMSGPETGCFSKTVPLKRGRMNRTSLFYSAKRQQEGPQRREVKPALAGVEGTVLTPIKGI